MRNVLILAFWILMGLPVWAAGTGASVTFSMFDGESGFYWHRFVLSEQKEYSLEYTTAEVNPYFALNADGTLLRLVSGDPSTLNLTSLVEGHLSATSLTWGSAAFAYNNVRDILVDGRAVYFLEDHGSTAAFDILVDSAYGPAGRLALQPQADLYQAVNAFVMAGGSFYILARKLDGTDVILEAQNTPRPAVVERLSLTGLKAAGLAYDSAHKELYTFDSTSRNFVQIQIDKSWGMQILSLPAEGVHKMLFGSDGYLYWSNTTVLDRSKDRVGVEHLADGNIYSFALDLENNVEELQLPPAEVLVPKGGGRLFTPQFSTGFTDKVICTAEIQNGAIGLELYRVDQGCTFAVTAGTGDGVTPSQAVNIIAADRRGGLDTLRIPFSLQTDNAPALSPLPSSTASVEVLAETKWTYTMDDPLVEKYSFAVYERDGSFLGNGNYGDFGKVCAEGGEAYIAQSFGTGVEDRLLRFRASMGYKNGALLQIYPKSGAIDFSATPLHTQFVPYKGEDITQMREYSLDKPVFLAPGDYWIVLKTVGAPSSYQCTASDFLPNWEFATQSGNVAEQDAYLTMDFVRGLTQGFSVAKDGDTKATLTLVPGPSRRNSSADFYYLWSDGIQHQFASTTVSFVEPAEYPAFAGGPAKTVVGYSRITGSETLVPNWLAESAQAPREYHVTFMDSTQNLIQSASIMPDGSLSLYLTPNEMGVEDIQVMRCYQGGVECSPPVTSSIRVSTPPSLDLGSLPKTIPAGQTSVLKIPVADPDPGQLENATMTLHSEQVTQNWSSPLGAKVGGIHLAQEFQVETKGWVTGLLVKGIFKDSNVTVNIRKQTGPTYLENFSTTNLLANISAQVVPGYDGWHRIYFSNPLYMDPNEYYSWEVIGNGQTSDSLALTSVSASGNIARSAYRGEIMEGNGIPYTQMVALSSGTTLVYRLLGLSSRPAWASVSFAGGNSLSLSLSPAATEAGKQRLFLRASDGYSESLAGLFFEVLGPLEIVYTRGGNPVVAMQPLQMEHAQKGWLVAEGLSTSCAWNTEFLESADSVFFAGVLPSISSMGELSFTVGAGNFGVGNFRLRANCAEAFSSWDTARVQAKRAPTFAGKLPDSLRVSQDTTVSLGLQDLDAGDLQGMKVALLTMQAVIQQSKNPELKQGLAMTQSFQMPTAGQLAEIRVYAKFPTSPVRLSLSHDSLGTVVDEYVSVATKTLAWHRIPISQPVSLPKGAAISWMMSLPGACDENISWGVSSKNPYAGGSAYITGLSQEESALYDLAFEVWTRGTAPSFAKLVRDSKNVVQGIRFIPLASDTGSHMLMVGAYDGAAGASLSQELRVVPLRVSPEIPTSKLRIVARTEGQAVQLLLRNGDYSDLPKGGSVWAYMEGKDFVASTTIKSKEEAWFVALADSCRLDWYIKNADGSVAASGDTILTRLFPSTRVAAPDRWLMLGFGAEPVRIADLSASTLVYRWNELESGVTAQYISRSGLEKSEVGAGYWYLAADTVAPPFLPVKEQPKALRVELQNAGSGWNMVANPWSWTVALDSTLEYWSYDPRTGDYVPVNHLLPGMAAWVNVLVPRPLTLQPTPFLHNASGLSRINVARVQAQEDWSVQVRLVAGGLSDAWNYLGVVNRAQAGHSAQSPEPPAGLGARVSLAFVGADYLLARDMRDASEGASWRVALGADRARSGEMQFSGMAELRALGLSLVVEFADGSAQEVPTSGSVPVALAKGTSHATIRVLPVARNYALDGALQDLRFIAQGESVQLTFRAPLTLAGKMARVEIIRPDGSVVARQSLGGLAAGSNRCTVKMSAFASGVHLIQVRAGSSVLRRQVVFP